MYGGSQDLVGPFTTLLPTTGLSTFCFCSPDVQLSIVMHDKAAIRAAQSQHPSQQGLPGQSLTFAKGAGIRSPRVAPNNRICSCAHSASLNHIHSINLTFLFLFFLFFSPSFSASNFPVVFFPFLSSLPPSLPLWYASPFSTPRVQPPVDNGICRILGNDRQRVDRGIRGSQMGQLPRPSPKSSCLPLQIA